MLIVIAFLNADFLSVNIWRALLLNTIFITGLSLFGPLFFSFHKLADAKWIKPLNPILLAGGKLFGFVLALYLILFSGLGQNFPWVNNGSEKGWYLNIPFFAYDTYPGIRICEYVHLWSHSAFCIWYIFHFPHMIRIQLLAYVTYSAFCIYRLYDGTTYAKGYRLSTKYSLLFLGLCRSY